MVDHWEFGFIVGNVLETNDDDNAAVNDDAENDGNGDDDDADEDEHDGNDGGDDGDRDDVLPGHGWRLARCMAFCWLHLRASQILL